MRITRCRSGGCLPARRQDHERRDQRHSAVALRTRDDGRHGNSIQV